MIYMSNLSRIRVGIGSGMKFHADMGDHFTLVHIRIVLGIAPYLLWSNVAHKIPINVGMKKYDFIYLFTDVVSPCTPVS